MPSFRDYEVSKDAIEQAIQAGMTGSVEATLKDMARHAATFSKGAAERGIAANRRFKEWWLNIDTEHGIVTAVGLIDAPSVSAPTSAGPFEHQDTRTAEQKRIDKARVERAITKHFPRK